MKVLVVHNRYRTAAPSGENAVVDDDVSMLRENNVRVSRFTRESDEIRGVARFAEAAIGPVYAPAAVRDFQQQLRDEEPDVVHVHNVFPLMSPAIIGAAHARGTPVVHTVHNHRHACVNGLFYRQGRACSDCLSASFPWPAIAHGCYRGSRAQSVPMAFAQVAHRRTWQSVDRFIVLSTYLRQHIMDTLDIASDKIVVRGNSVPDPGRNAPPGRDLLYLGRLEESKGVRLILEAFRRSRTDRQLRVAGAGPLRAMVEEMAARDPRIHYLGSLGPDEVANTLRLAGIVLVPSLAHEAFPRVIAEALSHGRPVAASASISLSAVVGEEFGWLIPPEAALWATVFDLLSDTEVAQKGLAARAEYEKHFSHRASADRLISLYRELA
jgi:glycosyltransferase involved in cell wall biosynthesis